MVIDKTTGRGCALSLLSKTVTEKLIAEGIVGKTICRRRRINSKNIYDSFRAVRFTHKKNVYIVPQKSGESAEEPLWTPSFIDAGIWEQAVSKFPDVDRLDRGVEKYLLPKMDKYLHGISDAELVSLTRDFLIEHGILNTPVCQHNGKTYYFSEDEVYTLDKNAERFPYEGRLKFSIFKISGETCFNITVWRKAVSRFEVGATLKECIELFLNTGLVQKGPQESSPIDSLVQRIYPPIYERVPENRDKTTFDYIRMTVGLPRYQFHSWKALQDEVKKYRREIYQQVLQRLESDRQFKNYGVPINFLKVSDVILRRDFAMEIIFELKGQEVKPLSDRKESQ